MIETRLIMPRDADAVLNMAEVHAAESRPGFTFCADRATRVISKSLRTGDPTIFVAEKAGEIIGYLGCRIQAYMFSSGHFTVQEVFYVCPEHRGSRAAVKLIKRYLEWGRLVGAREMYFDISSPVTPERTLKLVERLGGRHLGYHAVFENGGL